MKRTVLALTVAWVVASASVQAQEWSGLYAGAHIGYASLKPEFTERLFEVGTIPGLDLDGIIGGALLGYNLEFGDAVIGLESDFGLLNANERINGSRADGNYTAFDADWNFHTRVRLGRPVNKSLVYGVAGLAMARMSATDAFREELDSGVDHRSSTLVGWTVGAGIEHPVSNRLRLRVEGLYDRYGSETFSSDPGEGEWTPTGLTIRAAFAFRF